jgi:glutamyl-tRNA reductase
VSVLVVGLSHKSAPVRVLERAAISGDPLVKLLSDLACAGPVAEVFVVSTCNRMEVYADVDRFHAGMAAIRELLARYGGLPERDLTPHLYVHYEDRAVSHLLAVACGLDSVVVGEEQILGQVRSAVRLAREQSTIGRVLGDLGRVALRVGKRARTETGIGRAGVSLLSLAVELAFPRRGGLAGRDVLVVGAGAMSALAVATASRESAASIVVANRSRRRAERLAARPGAAVTWVAALGELPAAMAGADVVICCTGAPGPVITADMVPVSRRRRLVFLDLAMPGDVNPAVGLSHSYLLPIDGEGEPPGYRPASGLRPTHALARPHRPATIPHRSRGTSRTRRSPAARGSWMVRRSRTRSARRHMAGPSFCAMYRIKRSTTSTPMITC